MQEFFISAAYLLNRYMHIVATTLLVGGTLFYELVVPIAIADLKEPQQLLVFARARWVFRRVVVWCSIILLFSGLVSAWRNLPAYTGREEALLDTIATTHRVIPLLLQPSFWAILHVIVGASSVALALSLVLGGRSPNKPIRWMRLSVLLLLITIFLASATRNARLRMLEGAGSSASGFVHSRE